MIPVALFVYARPDCLRQTLACLQANRIPFLYVFCDGPKTIHERERTLEVRRMVRAIDWCAVSVVEREENLGLGRSITAGVADVLTRHEAVIVFEDDLVCVEGTYAYLAAALHHYKHDPRVMSVTGWTHPRITPPDVTELPYFDGRSECLVWGTWRRAWESMEVDAGTLIRRCAQRGVDPYAYGNDLVQMAAIERERNIWAVRFIYWHILNGGLCLRPPRSLVEHIGHGPDATNATNFSEWLNPPLRPCPPLPTVWPEPFEHADCRALALRAYGGRPEPPSLGVRLRGRAKTVVQRNLRRAYHRLRSMR